MFDPWVGKIPQRREWLPTPLFLPGIFRGQRNLGGYSPWSHKESDMTEWLTLSIIFLLITIFLKFIHVVVCMSIAMESHNFPWLRAKLLMCHSFMVTNWRHVPPGSGRKDFITHGMKAQELQVCANSLCPSSPTGVMQVGLSVCCTGTGSVLKLRNPELRKP